MEDNKGGLVDRQPNINDNGNSGADNVEPKKTADDYFGYDKSLFEDVAEKVAETTTEDIKTIQSKVNDYLKKIEVDDNGKFVYPDDIDPALKLTIAATKAMRDNQSAYTKAQMELKKREAELEELKKQVTSNIDPMSLVSPEDKQKINELKYTDPDKWFIVMKNLEAEANKKAQADLNKATEKAANESVYEYRKRVLDEYNKSNGINMTPEQIELFVPPVYAKKLADGEITFDEYLETAKDVLYGKFSVKQPIKPNNTTDINKVGGGSTPHNEEIEPDIKYEDIIF